MRLQQAFSLLSVLWFVALSPAIYAQSAKLHEVHVEGLKNLSEAQVVALSGLTPGAQVGRKDLQDAADALVRTGLFAKVNYKFETHNESTLTVTFAIEENPRLPVSYDNFPWYSDSELDDAVKKALPFYDGHLPQAGEVVERAASALKEFLSARDPKIEITHQVIASPLSEGSEQQFHVEGPVLKIASLEFSDPKLSQDLAVRAHLSEIVDHPYSRIMIDVFLSEQIRPIYQQQGFLQAKIGPSEVRLSMNPNQKLPNAIPVYVPCVPGPAYRWKGVEWKGNSAISTITLTNTLGMKAGELANGQAIEGAWERIREEYGQRGYLEAKVTPTPEFDDAAHTIAYQVAIVEGRQFRYGSMTISGMSLAGERQIQQAWMMKTGDLFDKKVFEDFLFNLESHREKIFGELPVHYDTVGHFLQTDAEKGTVEVLLDFK